jgi:ubiquitin carboxyl-terminal hydrolase 7
VFRSKLHTYDDVVERVARQLGLDDPAKIRLTSHNCYSQQPKPQPIRYRGVEHLLDMLVHYNQVNLSLAFFFCQYERDFGIPNLQKAFLLKLLSVMIQTSDILYYEVLDIPLPELQFLKTLKVAFHHATKEEVLFTANHMLIFLLPLAAK